MMIALITKRKRPNVRMVAGSVSNINNGFTSASSIASTKATTMAVKKFEMSTPGRISARKKAFTAIIKTLNKKFTALYLRLNVLHPFQSGVYPAFKNDKTGRVRLRSDAGYRAYKKACQLSYSGYRDRMAEMLYSIHNILFLLKLPYHCTRKIAEHPISLSASFPLFSNFNNFF